MNVEPPETLVIIESIVYESNGFAIEPPETLVIIESIVYKSNGFAIRGDHNIQDD
jgi:hypothetical protein